MYCQHCGNQIPDDSRFCPGCGNRVATSLPGGMQLIEQPAFEYAGFAIRFAAYIIDMTILLLLFLGIVAGLTIIAFDISFTGTADESILKSICYLAYLSISYFYFAGQESSKRQATPGKRAVGIIVTDGEGRRISFGRATVRFIGRVISWFTFGVLYLIIPFTAKKQGLHDFMAGTVVIRKRG